MRRLKTLTDLDILGQPGLSTASPRLTARAILRNPSRLYAVMYAPDFDLYSLPGGGVEEGEDIETALRREVAEETGCSIESIEPLGFVDENRAHANYTQRSFYYIVTTRDETLRPHLTDTEQAHGTQALWCTLSEAWEHISTPVFELPQQKFLQARDMAALEAYMGLRITRVTPDMPLWNALVDYAANCSWLAGPHVADMLREHRFAGWESIFAAVKGEDIVGYCTFLQTDYYPENRYWPWISSIFVGEQHRGQGVCGHLIHAAIEYARTCGFTTVYIPSGMLGFYERYGFHKIDELTNYGGDTDSIFARDV
ncbi:MAG: GNAT family N-acetyltransferase [Clostridia bacterium]|nr:GNAT family N-acetyltransferase [Clostridia bacterium]